MEWPKGAAMKLFVAFAVVIWFLCGFAGAWRLEGLDDLHWKTIAKGPLSLVEAFNEEPVSYPGPD
jgi:hypothetical protein